MQRTLSLVTMLAVVSILDGSAIRGQGDDPWFLISVEDFRPESWSTTTAFSSGGASQVARTNFPGGNPDAYLEVLDLHGEPSTVTVDHVYTGAVYDPGTEGAVDGIDISADFIGFETGGQTVSATFLVEQGGFTYLTEPVYVLFDTWDLETLLCLPPEAFTPSFGAPPIDFSASGAPMTFGIRTNTSGDADLHYGIDNFRVLVHEAPNPGCQGGPPNFRVFKTDNGHLWGDDPLVPYETTVASKDFETANGIVLEEIVPAKTTFVPDDPRSDPRWSCAPGLGENSRCTLTLDPLPSFEEVTVGFVVRVDQTAVYGEEYAIFNEVSGYQAESPLLLPNTHFEGHRLRRGPGVDAFPSFMKDGSRFDSRGVDR